MRTVAQPRNTDHIESSTFMQLNSNDPLHRRYHHCNEEVCQMPGSRLTSRDRRSIATGLANGLGYAEIARRLARPTSTISREVARNGGSAGYDPGSAQRATKQRATKQRVRQR